MSVPRNRVGVPGDAWLSDADFDRFRSLLRARTGIALGPHKRHLLLARLDRRLRALGMRDCARYYEYLTDSAHAGEIETFINAITTNKTEFFREPHHFHYLAERWAPALLARAGRRLRLWSAACSTGEEPYTLAMVLREARIEPPAWDVRILASDIDTSVLEQARAGVYPRERIAPVPPALVTRYFQRRAGTPARVAVRPELKDLIAFRRLNLAEKSWPFRGTFDVVFCRNTLIYFDRDTQRAILERILRVLAPGGVLFLGHSESVFGLVDGLRHLGQTIYLRAHAGESGGYA